MVIMNMLLAIFAAVFIIQFPVWWIQLPFVVMIWALGYDSGKMVQTFVLNKKLQETLTEVRKEIYKFVALYGSPNKPEDKLNKELKWQKNN